MREIVISGDPGEPSIEEMLGVVNGKFLPRSVILFHPNTDPSLIESLCPFLKGLGCTEKGGAAYVCQNHTCSLPVVDAGELARVLEGS